MSKWIDADALHDTLNAKQKWVVRRGDKHNEGYTYDQVHFAIDDAPSIDIVRCQDCRHRYMDADLQVWTCTYGLMIKPDGFCNYGEREGE